MRVALAPRARPAAFDAPPLLDRRGARVILGCRSVALPTPLRPAADSLFGPRGVCLAGATGPLAICDTGHHRMLIWRTRPEVDGAPADLVLGQPDFASEGRNAGGAVGAGTLNVPTGVAWADGVLAVADAWNHRVLLWHGPVTRTGQPADVVLGQPDFGSASPNRGAAAPRADSLNWCYGVSLDGGRLLVADTGNRRALVWHRVPTRNGTPADIVLGQPGWDVRDEDAGGRDAALGMRWPHAACMVDRCVAVADAGKSRIMLWHALPDRPGVPCDAVLGQADAAGGTANRAAAVPTRASLNQPFGLARLGDHLVVADTANARLLGFAPADLVTGAVADRATGGEEGGWHMERDHLSWPYGVSARGATLAIADTGNNRVLLWESA